MYLGRAIAACSSVVAHRPLRAPTSVAATNFSSSFGRRPSSTSTMPATATDPIAITYAVDGVSHTAHFDYLIVACDPRQLALSTLTPLERRVRDALTSFTFRTSLFKAARPLRPELPIGARDNARRTDDPVYAVRFHPGVLDKMDGEVYGFRDEVMARDERYRPSPNGVTWTTTYQLEGVPLVGREEGEVAQAMDAKRDRAVKGVDKAKTDEWVDWVPKDAAAGAEEEVLTDYFPHFEAEGLVEELPWQVRAAQGENRTLYVSSFTCFESVLHCFLYARNLMGDGGTRVRLPEDRNARFAVCGAGPSGLLFASQQLVKKGYKNVSIFEPKERFGGKTYTFQKPVPADPDRDVPCELGTCYLSLGYEPMFPLFSEYDAGEVVALDKDTNQFRSIVDASVARTQEERENGVEYGAWTLRRNGPWPLWEQLEMYVAGIRYLIVHYATMGMTIWDCMPAEPPAEARVLENLERLVTRALENSERGEVGDEEVGAQELYGVLKDEKRDDEEVGPKGLFDLMDDLEGGLEGVRKKVSVEELKKACRNVFNTTFAAFLDDNKMEELKSVFVYGYQVQGYGTIDRIPAYYGMIWMTPAVLTGDIRQLFDKTAAASKRGTVNVVSKGWGTLWEKIVEKDLQGKIIFNAKISAVERLMDK